MNYYEFNIGDYRRRTPHLTPVEHYIYRTLLDWYMLDEEPLRADTGYLLRLLCLNKRQEKLLLNVLAEFFTLGEDGCYHNKRADEGIAVYRSRVDNGKKGGRPRKSADGADTVLVDDEVSETKAETIQNDSEAKPSQNQTKTELKPNKKATNNQKPITNYPSSSGACAREGLPECANGNQTETEPVTETGETFAMFDGWKPDETEMSARLKTAGLPDMGSDAYQTGLMEFRLYWTTRPDKVATQADWQHKLLRSLIDDKVKGRYRSSGLPEKQNGKRVNGIRLDKEYFETADYGHGVMPM